MQTPRTSTPGTNKMETAPVHTLLFSLSLPIMFSMMMQALYNIVDSVFIARFSEKALSAVCLTYPMQTLMIAISIGTCIGVNAFLSRTLGQKDLAKARVIVQHGVLLMLLSYLVFLLAGLFLVRPYFAIQTADAEIIAHGVDYMSVCLVFSVSMFGQQLFEKLLQANGRAVLSMTSQLLGALVNVALDPLLIFGFAGLPALGARGAAIATVIGQFMAFACAFLLNQHYNREIRFSFAQFRFDAAILREIYKIGLPAILMQSIGSLANFLLNGILLTFSATATAVFGLYYKLQNFVFMPVYGLTSGMLPILAYNLGARQKKRMLGALRWGMLYMAVIMLAGTAAFQLAPRQLLALFGASPEMTAIGVPALRIISLYFIFEGFCLISQTCFQSLGRGLTSLVCSLARQLVLLMPLAYLMSLGGALEGVWLAYPLTGVLSSAVCLLLWRDVYRKNIEAIPEG